MNSNQDLRGSSERALPSKHFFESLQAGPEACNLFMLLLHVWIIPKLRGGNKYEQNKHCSGTPPLIRAVSCIAVSDEVRDASSRNRRAGRSWPGPEQTG